MDSANAQKHVNKILDKMSVLGLKIMKIHDRLKSSSKLLINSLVLDHWDLYIKFRRDKMK